MQSEKEINLELVKKKRQLLTIVRPRDLESHTINTQPRRLNRLYSHATSKAENRCYAISIATVKLPNKEVFLFAS